jgi:hypothetical protein
MQKNGAVRRLIKWMSPIRGTASDDWQPEVWSNEVVKNETEGYSDNGVHHNTIQLLSG